MFEKEYQRFMEEQCCLASGLRLEQLLKDRTGEKKLLKAVIWPVLKTFEGLTLEKELVSLSGVRFFVDAFYDPLGFGFESEGFEAHAGGITRDRFNFERQRIRTLAMYGYKYIPFSWDEMNNKPEACRRAVYELLGRYSSGPGIAFEELSVYEREVLRYACRLNRPFRLADVCYCLNLGIDASRKVIRSLIEKNLIKPVSKGAKNHYLYELEEKAKDYLL